MSSEMQKKKNNLKNISSDVIESYLPGEQETPPALTQ